MARRYKAPATPTKSAVNWRNPTIKNIAMSTAPGTNLPTAPTTGSRPTGCPPMTFVETRLQALEAAVIANKGQNDAQSKAISNFNATVPPGCTTTAQNDRIQKLSAPLSGGPGLLDKLSPSYWIKELFTTKIMPMIKVGAGGTVVLVSGLALVYVAGRNTPGAGVAKTAVKLANPAAGAASKAAGGASRPARAPARPDLSAEKEQGRRDRAASAAARRRETESRAKIAEDERVVSRSYAKEARAAQSRGRSKSSLPGISNKTTRPQRERSSV